MDPQMMQRPLFELSIERVRAAADALCSNGPHESPEVRIEALKVAVRVWEACMMLESRAMMPMAPSYPPPSQAQYAGGRQGRPAGPG